MATTQPQVTKMDLVYKMPEAANVEVRRDLEFPGADGSALAMDMYLPPGKHDGPLPVVVLVTGFRDEGALARLGCRFKDMQSNISWARLIAASGMAAVLYTNRAPAGDVLALLAHVRRHASALGVDAGRVGLCASSGHVPTALSALMGDAAARVNCAALLYGFTLDLDGATGVADQAKTFGFETPCAGRTVGDLANDAPMFFVRAGKDQFAGLNDAMDRLVAGALAANLPLTLVNHANGPHAFDLFDDTEMSREIIRRVLGFLRFQLDQV